MRGPPEPGRFTAKWAEVGPSPCSGAAATAARASSTGLQRAEKVQEVLFLALIELVEAIDDRVCLRRSERRVPRALVRLDGLEEVRGPPVVEEEDALP